MTDTEIVNHLIRIQAYGWLDGVYIDSIADWIIDQRATLAPAAEKEKE